MRNFKFLATTIVAIMLAAVLAVASFAAVTPFTDVDDKKNETLSDAVSLLNGIGVAKGVSETKFGTMDHVTREQMAAFVYRLMKRGKTLEGGANTTPFTDLTDSTYYGYVSWANGLGIIKGTSDTTFNPKGGIMLQDAYTMIVRALGYEDESYVYPYTYVTKAEELGLDEGLDSVVGYTTKLTRGDVAVVLYNTFFAELAKEERTRYETDADEYPEDVLLALKDVYTHPTVAEDIYDVEVGNFEVRATPKYAFNESEDSNEYIPLCDDFDVDTLHLVAADEDEPLQQFYCNFADANLPGAADDYIMCGVKVFYTYVEEHGQKKLDKIYFVNGSNKVLETSAAAFDYVDAKEKGDYYYYTRGTKINTYSDYEKVKGYLTVGNETIYFFDAPYSYAKPKFTVDMTADEREELINEKNAKLIGIKSLDDVKGTYSYYVDDVNQPTNNAEDVMKTMNKIYARGVYKIKFFDIDSDGIYEYAQYKPATYGFMDADDDKLFSSHMEGNKPLMVSKAGSALDVNFVPTIYYNEANITGEKFEDGDMVLAYLDPAANMIDVMAVVKPYNGYINQVKSQHGQVRIDSTTFQSAYVWRYIEEFDDGSPLYETYHLISNSSHDFFTLKDFSAGNTFAVLMSNDAVGEVFDIYAYKINGLLPQILYYDHIEDVSMSFGLDELAIPVSDKKNPGGATYTKSRFDVKLGEDVQYVEVYFNGKVSYIAIDRDEMYPALSESVYSDGVFNLSEIIGQDGLGAYVDKICKVVERSDGRYVLVPLLHAEDEDGEYVGVGRKASVLAEDDTVKQYGNDLGYETEGFIRKIAGSRFQLLDGNNETLLGDLTGTEGSDVKYFTMTAGTRIIIKNKLPGDKPEYEYLEFDASTFKSSSDTPLTNIQYILKNNPDSTLQEDLVLLYAEAEDFEFTTKAVKNGWRIVAGSEIKKDDEGFFRNYYKLLNPYSGEVEEGVAGKKYDDKAATLDEAVENGTIIKVINGLVDEEGDVLGVIDTSNSEGLVYLTEYNADEEYVTFVPVEAIENDICCKDDLEMFVDSYKYSDDPALNFDGEEFKLTIDGDDNAIYERALSYTITEETVISVLVSDEAGADAVEGEFKLADINALTSKEYKCYNDKVLNRKGDFGTEYAEYVKAYIYTANEPKYEDELPVAEYIIIVVNGDEELIFTDYDDKFYPDTCPNP